MELQAGATLLDALPGEVSSVERCGARTHMRLEAAWQGCGRGLLLALARRLLRQRLLLGLQRRIAGPQPCRGQLPVCVRRQDFQPPAQHMRLALHPHASLRRRRTSLYLCRYSFSGSM